MGDSLESGTSEVPTISDLANEHKSGKSIPIWKRVSLPMGALAVMILMVNAIAVALPMGLVLTKTANDASQSLVAELMDRIVLGATSSINIAFQDPINVVHTLAYDPSFTGKFIANTNDLSSESQLMQALYWRLNNSLNTDSLAFISYPNASGHMDTPAPPGYLNVTLLGFLKPNTALWQDYSTVNEFGRMIDPATGLMYGPVINTYAPAWALNSHIFDFYNYTTYQPGIGKWMIWSYGPTIMISYKEMFFAPTYPNPPTPLMMTQCDISTASTVEQVLTSVKPTAHTVNILIDNDYGLVGTSIGNLADNGVRPLVYNTTDGFINEIGAQLMARFPKLADLPDSWSSSIKFSNGSHFVRAERIDTPGFPLVFVTTIPRSDFLGEVDRGQRNGLIMAVLLAIAFTTLGSIALTMMVRPLRTLTEAMRKLTKFDFASVSQSGMLKHRSMVLELRTMEIVFDTMCKAFAGAIKRNRDMAQRMTSSVVPSSSGDHAHH